MPYTPPDDQATDEDAPEDAHRRYEQRRQELQVRLTAQRILSVHLRPEAAAVFWADIDLNLTEARLYQFDLTDCQIRRAQIDRATFDDNAYFNNATFASDALFEGAEFAGQAVFYGAEFVGDAIFYKAKFVGDAGFYWAMFVGHVIFEGADFTGDTQFNEARVTPGSHRVVLPAGWTTRAAQLAKGEEEGWLYVVRDEESNKQPTEANDGSSDLV